MEYNPELATALKRDFIQSIVDMGLVMVPKDVAMYGFDFVKKQNNLLKKKAITPYNISKYKLIPGCSTIQTIKNMVNDGRIGVNEHYYDNNKLYILTIAIKRIRGDE